MLLMKKWWKHSATAWKLHRKRTNTQEESWEVSGYCVKCVGKLTVRKSSRQTWNSNYTAINLQFTQPRLQLIYQNLISEQEHRRRREREKAWRAAETAEERIHRLSLNTAIHSPYWRPLLTCGWAHASTCQHILQPIMWSTWDWVKRQPPIKIQRWEYTERRMPDNDNNIWKIPIRLTSVGLAHARSN